MSSIPYGADFGDFIVGQSDMLCWDFGKHLPNGVTLASAADVSISVIEGTDGSPGSQWGAAALIGTQTLAEKGSGITNGAVKRKFAPTIGGVKYLFVAEAISSDGLKVKMMNHISVVTPE